MEKAPVKHNRLRRMENHDYTLPCIYLITVTTEGRQRLLGTLVGDSAATAAIEPTPLGAYVTMAPHSSTLAWKISWTEEPGRLQSMGSLRVGHD